MQPNFKKTTSRSQNDATETVLDRLNKRKFKKNQFELTPHAECRISEKEFELVRQFWDALPETYFDQFTVAPVTGRKPKTLECDRWKKSGIPYRKVQGRVLYQKKDVIAWLEGHPLVNSTSEYKEVSSHD